MSRIKTPLHFAFRIPHSAFFINLCLLLSCNTPPEQEAVIRIGVITTLSGEMAQSGEAAINGARMALQEIHDAGGLVIDGRSHRIELFYEDDRNISEEAVNAARKLINQNGVIALIGPFSSHTAIPVAVMAEQARVPMISPSASDPEVTAGKQYVFRMGYLDDVQGRVLARFARDEIGARTAAVLYDIASPHNRGIAEIFREEFENKAGRVSAFESYTTDQADFSPQLYRIRNAKPDVLFLPNYPSDTLRQIRQARRLDITATLLGSDAWTDMLLSNAEDASIFEGAFQSVHWHPDIPDDQTQRFTIAYKKLHGIRPSDGTAQTYDAFNMIFNAIRQQGHFDGEQIRQALTSLDHRGVTGSITYRGTGDPIRGVVVVQIRDGRLHFFKQIAPDRQ